MTRKLKSLCGETLVEVLVSMLIITLGMLMLESAILASARVNRKAASDNVQIAVPADASLRVRESGDWTVTVDYNGTCSPIPVNVYSVVVSGGNVDEGKILRYYETTGS